MLTLPNSSVWVRWQKETEKPRLGRHQLIQLIPSPRRSPPGCHRLMRLIRALIAGIVVVVVVSWSLSSSSSSSSSSLLHERPTWVNLRNMITSHSFPSFQTWSTVCPQQRRAQTTLYNPQRRRTATTTTVADGRRSWRASTCLSSCHLSLPHHARTTGAARGPFPPSPLLVLCLSPEVLSLD